MKEDKKTNSYVFNEKEFEARKALANIRVYESSKEISESMSKKSINVSTKKYSQWICK